jgi:arylsulfatase A-like enzyme
MMSSNERFDVPTMGRCRRDIAGEGKTTPSEAHMRPLLVFAVAIGILAPGAGAAETKPNIVFILADDLGINDLHCYGRADHRTPNLDRLAASGTRFTSAYAACPVCSPTRAALMTGKAPARLHLTTFLPGRADCNAQKLLHPAIAMQLPLAEKTLAEYLKEAGYATGCFGKWHLGGKGFLPTDQGFDEFAAGQANTKPSATEGGKGEYDLTARAEAFIDRHRDKPFFLYLPHNNPHIPYSARPETVAKNAGALEPVYAAVIETLDDAVGRLLAKLDQLKLTERTIVIFTSDNGGLHVPEGPHPKITHNTPYRAGKGFLYEGGIRVPAIVRWPGKVPAGQTIAAPTITMDWLPTLLQLALGKSPDGLDGESVAGLLSGAVVKRTSRPLYWHIPHYCNQGSRPSGAIRDSDWKLIEHYEDGSIELFNLRADPSETMNLAAKEPERASAMRDQLVAWKKAVGSQENKPNPQFDATMHKRLYVDVDVSQYNAASATPGEFARVQEWRKLMNAALKARGK